SLGVVLAQRAPEAHQRLAVERLGFGEPAPISVEGPDLVYGAEGQGVVISQHSASARQRWVIERLGLIDFAPPGLDQRETGHVIKRAEGAVALGATVLLERPGDERLPLVQAAVIAEDGGEIVHARERVWVALTQRPS